MHTDPTELTAPESALLTKLGWTGPGCILCQQEPAPWVAVFILDTPALWRVGPPPFVLLPSLWYRLCARCCGLPALQRNAWVEDMLHGGSEGVHA